MIRSKKKLFFRKKVTLYKKIRRNSSHHLVNNGFYSIKSTVEGNVDIPQNVKNDILILLSIIQKPFDEIIELFEDQS